MHSTSLLCSHDSHAVESGVNLVVVGGSNAQCSGTSVTLQCILAGITLTWNTPIGALNFVRDRGSESYAGSYHGQLFELNSTHLRSTLTFTFSNQITINCSNDSASDSITVTVEGIIFTQLLIVICYYMSSSKESDGVALNTTT